jgi:hypothetical protein
VLAKNELSPKKNLTAQIADLMIRRQRCMVCGLQMPRNSEDEVCSRRCAGLRNTAVLLQTTQLQEIQSAILSFASQLRDGATICPGTLAQKILPTVQDPLRLLRPVFFYMQETGRIRLSQKGAVLPWWKIRGPFRVGRMK